jgi:transcriptional regulator with XRE-family HTH domain
LEREQFGARMRQVRTEAGLTGEQLAGLLGVNQSTISRVENGKILPSPELLEAWMKATHTSEPVHAELADLLEAAATDVASWRRLHRQGLRRKQEAAGEVERAAHTIRTFQPVCVPGLLQIAEYARLVMSAGNPFDQPDIAEAVGARLQRQAILYDETKRFEFILTEGAIRWRPGSVQMQRAQLAHLISISSLPNVDLGVIPLEVQSDTPYTHIFILTELAEETVIIIETITAELQVRDPRDIEVYREYLERLRRLAVWGDDAGQMISAISAELAERS